jgi:hypothetical protein
VIRPLLALAFAMACLGGVHLAWQQARTHAFEQRLLTLEVENRERLGDVLLAAGETAPAPALPGDGGARLELRARWWMAWAERSERSATRTELIRRARDELRAAVRARPGSAFAWASLAAIKVRLGGVDREFIDAFAAAQARGGNELRIQRQLLGALLRHPERTLDWHEHEARALARRIERRDPYLLIGLASRYHATAWMCADTKLQQFTRGFCVRQGFSSTDPTPP